MKRNGTPHTAVYALAAALLAATSVVSITAVQAQQPAQRQFTFNIPSKSVPQAVNDIGRVTGLSVVFPENKPIAARSQAVHGSMTAGQALTTLLAGTGLSYRFSNATTVMIVDPSAQTAGGALPAGAIPLDTIDVQGGGNPNSTMSLPPAYAGGQIARGGQLGMLGNKDMMNTPFNQTVYTRKLIEDQQSKSVGDVLSNDPSVVKIYETGAGFSRDQWQIRGIGANAQNTAFGGLFGFAPVMDSMPVESLERVEVLKGATALLNGVPPGQGASLGAVNLVPKRAGDDPLIAFTPSYAMNSQFGGHLDVGQRFGDNKEFGVRFNGVYRNGDTPIDHLSLETRLATLGLDYRGENVRVSADLGYHYQYMNGLRSALTTAAGIPVPRPPDNNSNWAQPWEFSKSGSKYATTRAEWDINEAVTVYAAIGRIYSGEKYVAHRMTVWDAAGTVFSPFGVEGSAWYTQNTIAEAGLRGRAQSGAVSHAWALTAGWGSQDNGGVRGSSPVLPPSNLYNPVRLPEPDFGWLGEPEDAPKGSRNVNQGFALADTMSILDERIQLMLGIRHQRVKQQSFTNGSTYDAAALSPAAALIVKPWQNVTLYANYMQGLQAGRIAPSNAMNFGEVFAPFKTTQYEVGTKIDFGRVAATLAAFTSTQPTYGVSPNTRIFGQTGKTRYQGIELTAFGQATESVRFLGGITFLDARLADTPNGVNIGNLTTGTPRYRATFGVDWDTPFLDGLTLGAMAQWQSSTYQDEANSQKVDGWYRFDLNASYTIKQPGQKPIIVRASLRNVLDRSYWANSGQYYLSLSEPRTFVLSTTFQF